MLRDTKILEPRVGVEPTTCRLRIGCSTTELPRPLIINDLFPCLAFSRQTSIKLPSFLLGFDGALCNFQPEFRGLLGTIRRCTLPTISELPPPSSLPFPGSHKENQVARSEERRVG